jgi:hypothetical protein
MEAFGVTEREGILYVVDAEKLIYLEEHILQ